MKISNQNNNFCGHLYLKNKKAWTKDMLNAIKNNESIQKKLQTCDIIGTISSKVERRVPPYFSNHEIGDTLYKVRFVTKNENQTFSEKLLGLFKKHTNKYIVNRHYRSEYTTVERLEDMRIG